MTAEVATEMAEFELLGTAYQTVELYHRTCGYMVTGDSGFTAHLPTLAAAVLAAQLHVCPTSSEGQR